MSWIVFGISAVVLLLYGSLLLYYRIGWISLPQSHVPIAPVSNLRMSIIIPARNEAERIGACLQSIQQQNLPKDLWEVWVMNDFSEDATADIVQSMNDPISIWCSCRIGFSNPSTPIKKRPLNWAFPWLPATLL